MGIPILNPPQLLKCCGCDHSEAVTDPNQNVFEQRCPKCQRAMTLRCGTKARPNRPHSCFKFAKLGRRCNRHGGMSKRGSESARFVDGRRSKYTPLRWGAGYEDSLADKEVQTGHRREIALMDQILNDALMRLDTGESGEAWKRLREIGQEIRTSLSGVKASASPAQAGERAKALLSYLETTLLPVIDLGVGEEAARNEIADVIERKSKLVKTSTTSKGVDPELLRQTQSFFIMLAIKYIPTAAVHNFMDEIRTRGNLVSPRVINLIEEKSKPTT